MPEQPFLTSYDIQIGYIKFVVGWMSYEYAMEGHLVQKAVALYRHKKWGALNFCKNKGKLIKKAGIEK